MKQEISWNISVPIFRNSIILKQIAIAIGIPFGAVGLIIAITSGASRDTFYAIGLIAALMLFTWIFIMAVYRGRYEAEFVLDEKGVTCRTQEKQRKKNRIINTLTVILGFISGKPAVSGAGMLAQSGQKVFIRWKDVRKLKTDSKGKSIYIKGNFMEQIAVFCTDSNYKEAVEFAMSKYKEF